MLGHLQIPDMGVQEEREMQAREQRRHWAHHSVDGVADRRGHPEPNSPTAEEQLRDAIAREEHLHAAVQRQNHLDQGLADPQAFKNL